MKCNKAQIGSISIELVTMNDSSHRANMQKILVKIAGPETPCDRCRKTKKNIEEALAGLSDYDSSIEHISLTDKTTLETYGSLKGPAVIINEYVVSEGDVPTQEQIKRAIKQILSG